DRKNEKKTERGARRRRRVRGHIQGTPERPRMTVARSLRQMFVQIIDDRGQVTLLGLGTLSKTMTDKMDPKDSKTVQAKKLGEEIARQALEKGITQVVFDRNRFRYHGRVKAIAEGAREKGLKL
ncbi:MAG: 50S ribosomal protein L18, partial [candidate division Zixibacteria bacterium]|nr:50S ribosomal protein L18 [candidate division Zixibacteria bacterium]